MRDFLYLGFMEIFYHTLPNGLRIVHQESMSEVAYIGIMIGAGTRDENKPTNGMAHYIEHCVFKGTHSKSASQIIRAIEDIGGEINAYTTKEETTYYAATPRRYFGRTLHLLSDLVSNATFPKKETEKEYGVILEEIESYNDSPSELIYDDFESILFDQYPIAMPILGTKKSLQQIQKHPESVQEWLKQYYVPSNMVLFSQGNIAFDKVIHYASTYLGQLPPANHCSRSFRQVPELYTPQHISYHKHTHQVHIMLGSRSYPIGHKRQLSMFLLNNILGGGSLSSRLNLSLREKKGLVYTIESQYVPLSDTGYWGIYLACEAMHKNECIDLVHKELKRLREQPLSSIQLKRALNQIHGQMAISAENQENKVLSMGKQVLYHNVAPTWQQTYQRLESLTSSDLLETANEMLQEKNISSICYE